MNTIKQLLAATTFALGTLTYAFPAEARELGGLNLNRYCRHVFKDRGARAVPVTQNAWGWHCKLGGDLVSLSMDNACKWQYRSQRAYAQTSNPADPNSWKCFKAD